MEKGYLVAFKNKECIIYDKENHNEIIVKIKKLQNKKISLSFDCEENRALKVGYDDDSWLWHIRYGNINERGINLLHNKKMVKGFPLIDCVDQVCESCILGKQHRDSFPTRKSWKANKQLELIHIDICGPMKTLSLHKNKYISIIFVDDFSRKL